MIRELSITNLGVIAHTTLEFDAGLTVLTGETGAGKTLITTALSLLLGAKADPALVRHGAADATIDCTVLVDADLTAQLDELGASVEAGECIVTRSIGSRSRALVGARPVAASVLASMLGERLTVHGQHGQVRLTRGADQRALLDAVEPAVANTAGTVRHAWQNRRDALAALDAAKSASAADAHVLAAHRALVDDVENVAAQRGEDAQLDTRIAMLAAREAIERTARTAFANLVDGDLLNITDASTMLAQVRRLLEPHSELPQFAEWSERLEDLQEAVRAVGHDMGAFVDGLDADEGNLDALMSRRAQISGLLRRWNMDLDSLLARADDASRALALAEDPARELEQLAALVAHCEEELRAACDALHEQRTQVARRVAERVTDELRELGLPHAEFQVSVERNGAPAAHGDDTIEFRFTANPGQPAQALATVGSGGELSRVMLALESVAAPGDIPRTFVFDEVDAGIGGRAALEVGRRLTHLAQTSQVIVVTHLAQVAAFADCHIVVEKEVRGGETLTRARRLSREERPRELTRLLSGVEDSAAALAHAEELLVLAGRERAGAA